MAYWKCKVCGDIRDDKTPPEECNICSSGSSSFVKVDGTEADLIEAADGKKKYRRIFKKGFERRLSKK